MSSAPTEPTEPTEPTLLKPSQIPAAAHILGGAFQDDPLMIYLVADAGKRRRLLPSFFRVVARYCVRYGAVYTTPILDGLACCLPPGQTNPTIARLALASLSGIPPVQIGAGGLRRFLHAASYMDAAHQRAAPGAHWYLWALGVAPERQGQGIGGMLLDSVLQQAKAQRLPCYLDTENPRNVPFYQRHGFRLVGESTVPDSAVRVYALLWEPS